jgi:quinol monooxygenase YgiN
MLVLQVHLRVKPEALDAFRAATIENARNSVREPGIVRFDFLQHSDDPHRFTLWEVYRTEAAVEAHRATAHYAAWQEAVKDLMAEPRTRDWYKSVFPEDAAW